MRRARSFSVLDYCAVYFFAALVLLTETLLFHATKLVLDYTTAMAVIGCAVAGIGWGAFLAGRPGVADRGDWFAWCCAGLTMTWYVSAGVLLQYAHLAILLPAMAMVFAFPGFFIAVAFSRGPSRGVYLADMLGAGSAVGVTVLAYRYFDTETIFLGLATLVPRRGAGPAPPSPPRCTPGRVALGVGLLVAVGAAATLLVQHRATGAWNIVRVVNPDSPNLPAQSLLRRPSRLRVEETYDSLEGRLDTVPATGRVHVTYDGFFNDNFRPDKAQDYLEYARPHDVQFPTGDRRVVYGLVREPRVFVIGPATPGILKPLRMITPLDHIEAVEVNPGVLQIMQQDYAEASGHAYSGLQPVLGNALAVLRRSNRKYDMITLINAHSTRWIGALGPPDCLHTRESYDLYLDHLTDDGYLLFEERPDTLRGELGLRRMIHTLYDCLQRRGAADPAEHFFIWEFMSHRHSEAGGKGIETGSDKYYVGMIVSLQPLVGKRRDDLLAWYNMEWFVQWDERKQPIYYPATRQLEAAYLKSHWANERFGPFFDMLAADDFTPLGPDFDDSLITDDRPFASYATRSIAELRELLLVISSACCVLASLLTWASFRGTLQRLQLARLMLYFVTLGLGYFLVEIVLIQAYQDVFLSPSTSLAVVLGVLLCGSAVGGLLAERIAPWQATLALVPVLSLCLYTPDWTLDLNLSPGVTTGVAVAAIFLVGLNMGIYFPTGLQQARRWSLHHKIPYLFAINAVAGALASVVSLALAVRIGYLWTLAIALSLYLAATLLLRRR